MSDLALAFMSFPVLVALIALRAPVGLAMLLCGLGGLWALGEGPALALARLKTESFSTFSAYSLSIIPMFLLMGQFATQGGLSAALFRAAGAHLGHRRGGLGMAAIGACAGFGAICGSSLATAATMGQVALPELKRAGWEGGLANAVLAAGGTLGILIPPSIVLVIFATLTELNIGALFAAALVPGLLAAGFYALAIRAYLWRHPEAAPAAQIRPDRRARWASLVPVWPVLVIFGLVVGGIYGGWFTPTEGAAIGAAATGISAWASGRLGWRGVGGALLETAKGSAMIYFIILGAGVYNGFLGMSRLPQEISGWIAMAGWAPILVIAAILLLYLVLGCVMDSLSMILLTTPIFWPVVKALDLGLAPEALGVWFGVLTLIAVEVGLITPPVGMNLFVLGALDPDTPPRHVWKASAWFVGADLLRLALLVAFPGIVLFVL